MLSNLPVGIEYADYVQFNIDSRKEIKRRFEKLDGLRDVTFESRSDSVIAAVIEGKSFSNRELESEQVQSGDLNRNRQRSIKLLVLKCMLDAFSDVHLLLGDISGVNETIDSLERLLLESGNEDVVSSLQRWRSGSDSWRSASDGSIEIQDVANNFVHHLNFVFEQNEAISNKLNEAVRRLWVLRHVVVAWNRWVANNKLTKYRIRQELLDDLVECTSTVTAAIAPPLRETEPNPDLDEPLKEGLLQMMHKLTDVDGAFTSGTTVGGMDCFLEGGSGSDKADTEDTGVVKNNNATNWKGAKQLLNPGGMKGLTFESEDEEDEEDDVLAAVGAETLRMMHKLATDGAETTVETDMVEDTTQEN